MRSEAAGNSSPENWLQAAQAAEDINPSNTADVVGLFSRADADTANRAS
jgi:hypothetical protein